MFSAMILACAFTPNGSADMSQCISMAPDLIMESQEECMTSLQYGIAIVDEQSWAVVDYYCFDWKTKSGTQL